jgi:uncharacterized membrane protein YphA (DoxX/SURF4 family)
MKYRFAVARILMGVMFVVFGSNGFLHFIPMPPPPSDAAGKFFTVMSQSHYLVPVFLIQVVAGVLFLINRFVPLALTLIAPVIFNILVYHATMDPAGIVPGVVAAILWGVVFARHRQAFAGILRSRPLIA